MSTKYEPQARKSIRPGIHTGKIVEVKAKMVQGEDEEAEYFEIVIELDDVKGVSITHSVPNYVRYDPETGEPTTKLARVLAVFTDITKGGEAAKVLVGKKVRFQTTNVKGKSGFGTFARIADDSFEKA